MPYKSGQQPSKTVTFEADDEGKYPKIPKKYAKEHQTRAGGVHTVYLYDNEEDDEKAEPEEEEDEDESEDIETPSLSELKDMSRAELDDLAEELDLDPDEYPNKSEIIKAIRKA